MCSLILGLKTWSDCLWPTVGRMKGYRPGLLQDDTHEQNERVLQHVQQLLHHVQWSFPSCLFVFQTFPFALLTVFQHVTQALALELVLQHKLPSFGHFICHWDLFTRLETKMMFAFASPKQAVSNIPSSVSCSMQDARREKPKEQLLIQEVLLKHQFLIFSIPLFSSQISIPYSPPRQCQSLFLIPVELLSYIVAVLFNKTTGEYKF